MKLKGLILCQFENLENFNFCLCFNCRLVIYWNLIAERKFPSLQAVNGMSVEDLAAICLGCAMNLSHHTAALKTRLAQLQVQPDLTLRTALDGITEVRNARTLFFTHFFPC